MTGDKKVPANPPERQEGLPNPDSIVEVKEFVSPKGRTYTILRTTEADATDKLPETKNSPANS